MLKFCDDSHEPLAYDDRRADCPACVLRSTLVDRDEELRLAREELADARAELEAADLTIFALAAAKPA